MVTTVTDDGLIADWNKTAAVEQQAGSAEHWVEWIADRPGASGAGVGIGFGSSVHDPRVQRPPCWKSWILRSVVWIWVQSNFNKRNGRTSGLSF